MTVLEKLETAERRIFVMMAVISAVLMIIGLLIQGYKGFATALVIMLLYISMYRKYTEFHLTNKSKAKLSFAVHTVSIVLVGISAFAI